MKKISTKYFDKNKNVLFCIKKPPEGGSFINFGGGEGIAKTHTAPRYR